MNNCNWCVSLDIAYILALTVMDGAAVVHFLPIGESKTFAEYDIPSVYLKDSLNLSTRANRATGIRKRVSIAMQSFQTTGKHLIQIMTITMNSFSSCGRSVS